MELTGRVTGDAVIKTLPDDRQIVNFSIAINEYVKPKKAAKGREYTLYVSCGFWKKTGVATKLVKGAIAEVSGRMYIRVYTGADNEPKASLHLNCNNIKVHGKKTRKEVKNAGNEKEKSTIENIAHINEPGFK